MENMEKLKYCISYHWLIYEDKYGEDLAVWENLAGAMKEHLRMMEEYDIRASFELSAAEALDLKERHPAIFSKVEKVVKEGKAELVEGSFSQPHLHLISGESNIRQFEYGLKVLRELFGKESKINLFLRQEAGHHAQLPQILSKFGFTCAFPVQFGMLFFRWLEAPPVINNLGMLPPHGSELVYWVGMDGSLLPFYMVTPKLPKEAIQSHFESNFFRRDTKDSPIYYFCPDHNSAPRFYDLLDLRNHLTFCTMSEILQGLELSPRGKVEIWSGSGYAFGKLGELGHLANRRAETAIIEAEKIATLVSMLDEGYSFDEAEFENLWKKLLASQHHDNWWINTITMEEEGAKTADSVFRASCDIINESIEHLCKTERLCKVGTSEATKNHLVVLFNSLSWPREDLVTIGLNFDSPCKKLSVTSSSGKPIKTHVKPVNPEPDGSFLKCEVSFIAETPSFGYSTYFIVPGENSSPGLNSIQTEKNDQSISVRNDKIGLVFDTQLCGLRNLSNSTDKANIICETVKLAAIIEGKPMNAKNVSVTVEESIPLKIKSYQEVDFGSIIQEFTVYPEFPFVDIETRVNILKPLNIGEFEKEETPLRMVFNLGEEPEEVFYDIPFGKQSVIFPSRFFPLSFVTVRKKDTLFSVFHKGTHLWYWKGNKLSNTLVCANKEWTINLFRGKPEDMRFTGKRKFYHRLLITKAEENATKLFQHAQEYFSPIVSKAIEADPAQERTANSKSFFAISAPNVLLSTMYRKQDDIIVRVLETSGKKTSFSVSLPDTFKIFEGNITGEKRLSIVDSNMIEINPWEIKTIIFTKRR